MQPEHIKVKHIELTREDEHVKRFVLALNLDREGSVLELNGEPVVRVVPAGNQTGVDVEKLESAIVARRDESRALNEEWINTDREVWDQDTSQNK